MTRNHGAKDTGGQKARARTNEVLRSIIEATSSIKGMEFLHLLVRQIATALDFKYAFIGEVADTEMSRVRTLAVWAGGSYAEPFEYDLKDTPCDTVVGKTLCIYRSDVQKLFPKDHMLIEMGAESYIGVPLVDTRGKSIGIIAALDVRPISEDIDAGLIFSTLASRAGIALERNIIEKQTESIGSEIEKRVSERTADLKNANAALREQILERIKAVEALRESEALYRTLAESAQDYICKIDRNLCFEYVNGHTARFLGMSKDELTGRPLEQILPREMFETVKKNFQYVFETGKAFFKEERFIFNGEDLWLGTRLNPIITKGEGVKAVLSISRDITERMRWTAELQAEKDRARKYLDVAGVMLVAIDSSHNVMLINRKGCEILGYSETEIIGRNWFDNFIPERLRATVKLAFTGMINGKMEIFEAYENPILAKDGREKIIEWKNSALKEDDGRIIGTLSSGEDITGRKRREAEREKLITDLTEALANIKTLKGLLPICASCKKIRDDKGYWKKIEIYIQEHSEADFSHGICPECSKKLVL